MLLDLVVHHLEVLLLFVDELAVHLPAALVVRLAEEPRVQHDPLLLVVQRLHEVPVERKHLGYPYVVHAILPLLFLGLPSAAEYPFPERHGSPRSR